MKIYEDSFASRFAKFLKKKSIRFEIIYSAYAHTSFRLFDSISSRDMVDFNIQLPYWEIYRYDSKSFVFIVFETYNYGTSTSNK